MSRARKPDRPAGDPPLVDEQLPDESLIRAQAQGADLLGPDACRHTTIN